MTELFYYVAAFGVVSAIGMWIVCRYTRPPRDRLLSIDYTTPPDWKLCRNLVLDGPTPCWHPHCDCMKRPLTEPRPRLGADEVLRRHLHVTNPKRKSRVPRI